MFKEKYLSKIFLLLLIILTFITYLNSLRNPFIYDDLTFIVERSFIRDLKNIPELFTVQYFSKTMESTFRPLNTLTYFINYFLWNLKPHFWRLTYLIIHIINALLVIYLLLRITGNKRISIFTGFIFSLHPVHTEVINGVSFSEDIVAFFFLLVSFIFYLELIESEEKKLFYIIISIVTYIFAVLSKENTIILPLIIVIYGFLFKSKRRLPEYAKYYLLIGILLLAFEFFFFKNPLPTSDPKYPGGTLLSAILTFFKAIVFYVYLLFIPLRLSVEHGIVPVRSLIDTKVILSLIVIISVLIYSIRISRIRRLESFGILWFLITLVPVSNIVPFNVISADRYLYLPSVGFSIFMASIFENLCSMEFADKNLRRILNTVSISIFIIILIFYSTKVIERNRVWRDGVTLWKDAVKKAPESARAHFGLGSSFDEKGILQESITEYKEAIRLDPKFYYARNNLANIYDRLDLFDEALYELKEAIKTNPRYSPAHVNLGTIYGRRGFLDMAMNELSEAIRLDPYNAKAYNNLGLVYKKKGMINEAIAQFKKAIELDRGQAFIFEYNMRGIEPKLNR